MLLVQVLCVCKIRYLWIFKNADNEECFFPLIRILPIFTISLQISQHLAQFSLTQFWSHNITNFPKIFLLLFKRWAWSLNQTPCFSQSYVFKSWGGNTTLVKEIQSKFPCWSSFESQELAFLLFKKKNFRWSNWLYKLFPSFRKTGWKKNDKTTSHSLRTNFLPSSLCLTDAGRYTHLCRAESSLQKYFRRM